MNVEYLDDGVLFCGHFVPWEARVEDIVPVAQAVARTNGCGPRAIERILSFELRRPQY